MSTLKINTLSNVAGTQSTAVENAIQGSAKAWVNFNGTYTVSIRKSYNVSSITDNGSTGNFTVNFITPMPDSDYMFLGTARQDGTVARAIGWVSALSTDSKTTSSLQIRNGVHLDGTSYTSDCPEINIAIFY